MNCKFCDTDIKDHPAGEHLDVMFAEGVMGWKNKITVYTWVDRKRKKYPLTVFTERPDNPMGDYSAFISEDGIKYFCGQPKRIYHVPKYSTNISDAMEGVERHKQIAFFIDWFPEDNRWRCVCDKYVSGVMNEAEGIKASSLAIIRALILWSGERGKIG